MLIAFVFVLFFSVYSMLTLLCLQSFMLQTDVQIDAFSMNENYTRFERVHTHSHTHTKGSQFSMTENKDERKKCFWKKIKIKTRLGFHDNLFRGEKWSLPSIRNWMEKILLPVLRVAHTSFFLCSLRTTEFKLVKSHFDLNYSLAMFERLFFLFSFLLVAGTQTCVCARITSFIDRNTFNFFSLNLEWEIQKTKTIEKGWESTKVNWNAAACNWTVEQKTEIKANERNINIVVIDNKAEQKERNKNVPRPIVIERRKIKKKNKKSNAENIWLLN